MNNDEELLGLVSQRAAAYMQQARDRRVIPDEPAVEGLHQLNTAFPELPLSPQEIVEWLDRLGSPATVTTSGGRFFGFVNGGALPASVAASWMVSAWDQNASLKVMSPAAAAFEEVALAWVCEILRLPTGCGGGVVTGGA